MSYTPQQNKSLFDLFFELNERVNFSKQLWIYDNSIYMKPIEILTYIFFTLNILPLVKLILTAIFYSVRIFFLIFYSFLTKNSLLLIRTIKNFPSRLFTSNFFYNQSRMLISIIIFLYIFLCISNLVYLVIYVINGNVYFNDYSLLSKVVFLLRDSLLFFFELIFILYYIGNKDNKCLLSMINVSGLEIKVILSFLITFIHLFVNFILAVVSIYCQINVDNLMRPYHTFKYLFFISLYGKVVINTMKINKIFFNWSSFLKEKSKFKNNSFIKLEYDIIYSQLDNLPRVSFYSFNQNENMHFNSKSKFYSVFYIRIITLVMLLLNFVLISCNTYFWIINKQLYDVPAVLNLFAIGKKMYMSLVSVILFCLFNKVEYKEIYLCD